MLKATTRSRLRNLVCLQDFVGSVNIRDCKNEFMGETYLTVDVDIHSEGFDIFSLLIEYFPDVKLNTTKRYESSCDFLGTTDYGYYADGKIEGANIRVWDRYGERKIEKDPAPTESIK